MNLEVANRLLKLRKDNNLSQEELAEKLGVTRQAISKWERGESSPDTDNLILLANLYRVSLDELLGIDVKTFKADYVPPMDLDAKTIKLTKPEELEDVTTTDTDTTTNPRVVYPKDSLDEEIYPKSNTSTPPPYTQSSPLVAVIPPQDYTTHENKRTKKRRRTFTPPPTGSEFVNAFERLMTKFNITYKGLYSFPIYALNIALAVLVDKLDQNYLYDSSFLSGAFILGIPLYYTFINAIQRRSYNRFGYPILALMLMCIGYSGGLEDKSALWLATIPFYYWYVNKNK